MARRVRLHAEQFARDTDLSFVGRDSEGKPISLRELLVHMIEEYAPTGDHADLLRERIDDASASRFGVAAPIAAAIRAGLRMPTSRLAPRRKEQVIPGQSRVRYETSSTRTMRPDANITPVTSVGVIRLPGRGWVVRAARQ